MSERPEMTSPWRAGASAKAAKRAIKEGQKKKRKLSNMKNETINPKSTVRRIKPPLVLAVCLILAAFGPPAAESSRAQGQGRGGPPGIVDQTYTLSGICSFDLQVTLTGRGGVISLPSGGLIMTGPGLYGTFTNLSDPTKSVTLNITGTFHISFDENGNTIYMATGRNGFSDPSVGGLLLIGDFTFVYDSNGNLISGPTGTGTITDICGLIN
jgi:hypothetical protein